MSKLRYTFSKRFFSIAVLLILSISTFVATSQIGKIKTFFSNAAISTNTISTLNNQIIATANTYQTSKTESEKTIAQQKITLLVQERKKQLLPVLQKSPGLFAQYILPSDTRIALPLSVYTKELVEQDVNLSGVLYKLHGDNGKNQAPSIFYRFRYLSGSAQQGTLPK